MKGDVPESAAPVSRRRGLLGWVLNRTSGREPVAAPSTFKPATVVEVDVPSCSDPVADDRPWGGGSGAEFWEYLLGEPYVPPAGVPPWPKGPAPTPMQRAKATVAAQDAGVQEALLKLSEAHVWSLDKATAELGDLGPLREQQLIVVAYSAAGIAVTLGMEGRRALNLNPHANYSTEYAENLLYLRHAAHSLGWEILRFPPYGAPGRFGLLDLLPLVQRGDEQAYVLARCTAGGWSPVTVRRYFKRLRATLIYEDRPLVVVVPDASRLARIPRNPLLIITGYPLPPSPSRRGQPGG